MTNTGQCHVIVQPTTSLLDIEAAKFPFVIYSFVHKMHIEQLEDHFTLTISTI